mmetsp:Transcript_43606/g.108523  ORF Transcript_43606/g.108523 Transcript_43606/m.108523 type:complete len:309 (-) Transcript_43606:182-1108(-)
MQHTASCTLAFTSFDVKYGISTCRASSYLKAAFSSVALATACARNSATPAAYADVRRDSRLSLACCASSSRGSSSAAAALVVDVSGSDGSSNASRRSSDAPSISMLSSASGGVASPSPRWARSEERSSSTSAGGAISAISARSASWRRAGCSSDGAGRLVPFKPWACGRSERACLMPRKSASTGSISAVSSTFRAAAASTCSRYICRLCARIFRRRCSRGNCGTSFACHVRSSVACRLWKSLSDRSSTCSSPASIACVSPLHTRYRASPQQRHPDWPSAETWMRSECCEVSVEGALKTFTHGVWTVFM